MMNRTMSVLCCSAVLAAGCLMTGCNEQKQQAPVKRTAEMKKIGKLGCLKVVFADAAIGKNSGGGIVPPLAPFFCSKYR